MDLVFYWIWKGLVWKIFRFFILVSRIYWDLETGSLENLLEVSMEFGSRLKPENHDSWIPIPYQIWEEIILLDP